MTEEEWLTATDPRQMLNHFATGDRKLRLFAAACCRETWELQTAQTKDLIYQAEHFADGRVGGEELVAMWESCPHEDLFADWKQNSLHSVLRACYFLIQDDPAELTHVPGWLQDAVFFSPLKEDLTRKADSQRLARAQTRLFRDIFGNPFRPVTFPPAWRTTTVTSLAQTIYEDRQMPSGLFDNQRMSILADALEEAGCDSRDILEHCRQGGEHVRGCWVVDLILGKE